MAEGNSPIEIRGVYPPRTTIDTPQISAELRELHEAAIARYPIKPGALERTGQGLERFAVRVAGLGKALAEDDLYKTGEAALSSLRTEVKVNGKVHNGSTIYVSNHPYFVEDLFVLTRALGEEGIKNLKILTTSELFTVIPSHLRQHFIPVDTGFHEQKMHLSGVKRVTTDVLHKVLPPSSLKEAGERNLRALKLASQHVANGGDLLIFEDKSLAELIARSDEGKIWFSGVGSLIEESSKLMPERVTPYVQMMAIDYVKGQKMNPVSRKTVELTIDDPASFEVITSGLTPVNRKTITKRLQNLYVTRFRGLVRETAQVRHPAPSPINQKA